MSTVGPVLSRILKLLGLDGVEVFQEEHFIPDGEELGNRIASLLTKENLWITKEKKNKSIKPWNEVAMLCGHQRISTKKPSVSLV